MGRLPRSARPSNNLHRKAIPMDVIERQAQGVSSVTTPDSTVRQASVVDGRAMPQPVGSGAARHNRDVLADFLQYDAKQ